MPFVDAQVQSPIPWVDGEPDQFECSNQTGEFQNIGVGKRSYVRLLTLSHIPFHTGFFEEGHHNPTTILVLNDIT